MANKGDSYWTKRAAMRMIDYQAEAERTANDLGKAYAAADSSMHEDMHRIFSSFQRSFKISKAQAKQILAAVGNESAMKELTKAANKIPDPETRQLALDTLKSAPAYSWRIARLDDMLDDVAKKCSGIYRADLKKTTDFLEKITRTAYTRTAYDYRTVAGAFGAELTAMNDSLVKTILKTDWSGVHYSKRIYANVEDMQTKLKQTLLEGVMTGESEYKLADKISERWEIGYNDARRLIRTETTFVTNQAELESYKEIGIAEYKYEAVLDSVTSEICRELNGKKFKISEAVPGKNYPPMHPWCRSTTVAVIPEIPEIDKDKEAALEGWVNDEEDLDYEEWCEKHHINPKTGKKVYQGNSKSAKAAQEQPKAATKPPAVPETTTKAAIKLPAVPETTTKAAIKLPAVPETTQKAATGYAVEIDVAPQPLDISDLETAAKIYRDEVVKKVDISGESGIIKLDLQFFAQIPEEKFTKYALDAEKQPDKARAFREALGYTKENYESLINNILNNFEEKNLRLKNENEYGKLYECVMRLTGANGKQANVCTGWIVEVGSDEPRLTSAYITNKEVTKK